MSLTRGYKSTDPWISLTDHGSAIGEGNLLYGENSFGGQHAAQVLPIHNGANVFIRLNANRNGCREQDVTADAAVVAAVMSPTGGGNRNIEIIRDGEMPPAGNQESSKQYDTFCSGCFDPLDEWVGYHFGSTQMFTKLVFQEGKHFDNGGWFETEPIVEVEVGGVWTPVSGASVEPSYMESSHVGASARSFDTFTFEFNSAVATGIRLRGQPGGSGHFISVGELRAFAEVGADC